MHRGKYLSVPLIIAINCWSPPAASTDIYHWVGDDGVVHFSDNPPVNPETVTTLHVNASNAPDYDPANDPYSIVNQAKRINEKWTQLEKERDQRTEERREQVVRYVQYPPPRYDGWRYNYWPGYYPPSYPVRPPSRPPGTIRRQASALDTLNLTGPRPHSINSGAHNARVESSNNFLSTISNAAPRPAPRRP